MPFILLHTLQPSRTAQPGDNHTRRRYRLLLLLLLSTALTGCFGPSASVRGNSDLDKAPRFDQVALGQSHIRLASWAHQHPDDATPVRTIIFVHGTPGGADNWASVIERTPPGFRAIAIDRPGFGRSEPYGPVTSLNDQAAALLPLLQRYQKEKPILVGHSLGGPIVARAALDYPDQIAGLVILAGAFDPELEKIYFVQHMANTDLLCWLLPRSLRNANQELIALKPQLQNLAADLPTLRTPVVMVHGTDDGLVPYDNVAFIQATLPAHLPLRVVTLDDMNHFLPWKTEDLIWQEIQRLDEQLRATPSTPPPEPPMHTAAHP